MTRSSLKLSERPARLWYAPRASCWFIAGSYLIIFLLLCRTPQSQTGMECWVLRAERHCIIQSELRR